ncbi:unnamed protein product [Amoebophrya sp. A25]|nr:unnamed protein product [Amoebophrya sp. A25]|eukprot:GSA25T00019741001.1
MIRNNLTSLNNHNNKHHHQNNKQKRQDRSDEKSCTMSEPITAQKIRCIRNLYLEQENKKQKRGVPASALRIQHEILNMATNSSRK